MELPLIIIFLGVLIFFSHLCNALFSFTKIPTILVLLAVGILLGPILGIVRQEHFGEIGPVFSTITLVFILFESGASLKLKDIASAIGSSFFITLFNFIISTVVATVCAHYLGGVAWMGATFFGVIVAGTSSAVVIPIVKQLKLSEKTSTILSLESALSDVLCLVIGLSLLEAMKLGVLNITDVLNKMWQAFLFAMIIGIVGGLVWSIVLKYMRKIENSIFTSLAFVFIIYGLAEYLGLNGGIATLAFGIMLGNAYLLHATKLKSLFPATNLRLEEKNFFSELVFILQTYFFVYVGVNIQFGSYNIYLLGLLIVLIIIASRPFSIRLFTRGKLPMKDLTVMAIMMPKGLVPAVLASLPVQLGLAGAIVIQDLAFSVVLLSIVICSVLVIILSKDPLSIAVLGKILAGKSIEQEQVEAREAAAYQKIRASIASNPHDDNDPPAANPAEDE